MRVALGDLRLEHLTVLYPGVRPYTLAERVTVVPLAALAEGDPEALGLGPARSVRPEEPRVLGRRTVRNVHLVGVDEENIRPRFW